MRYWYWRCRAAASDNGNEKLDAWAKKVCDAVQPQVKKIAGRQRRDPEGDLGQQHAGRGPEDRLGRPSRTCPTPTRRWAAPCRRPGAPPVDDGEKKQTDAVKELNDISTSYATLKKQVDELDTKDQAKFADGLKDIATELDKLSTSGNDALKKLEEGDVGKAMAKQDGCKQPRLRRPASRPPARPAQLEPAAGSG